jgi:fucose permease
MVILNSPPPLGLVGTLNGAIQTLAEYNASRSLALRIAYWVAYFLAPLIAGYWILTRFGFKPTFITGLGVYAVGALAFWPSSVLLSYAGFFISNFMVANGSALLEVAANPFIALAGPEHLMEARLNFSQGLQGIGSVLATLLATRVLFKDVGREALFKTQWVYLAVALWASLLGMCFYYVPLSEASDEDLELVATQRELYGKPPHDQHVWGCKILYLVTITGIFVMWLYVGVQQQLDYDWTSLMQEVNPG